MSLFAKIYRSSSHEQYDFIYVGFLLLFEATLAITIIRKVPYTEIDWKAYMEEVSCWLGDSDDSTVRERYQWDYSEMKGGTGPLVYPAGFLYLYTCLRWVCSQEIFFSIFMNEDGGDDMTNSLNSNEVTKVKGTSGVNIRVAQYLFAIFYIVNAAIVLLIYTKVVRWKRYRDSANKNKVLTNGENTNMVWSWRVAMLLTCFSKRVHSIFVLRLFNDAPCMLLLYLSTYLFMERGKLSWKTGCIFFSLAVSIKMNVLLFAPGLLLLFLQSDVSTKFLNTVQHLSICAIVQITLGSPFLLHYPINYLRKAFEFDRVFFHKWTVNWKVS
mmetsp:Transcript_8532/g.12158  ORF Transcript_8532/g.12158 Transcript_8532/m.12158 type:complete len:326 (-) Transcript_8532:902-1879(-)